MSVTALRMAAGLCLFALMLRTCRASPLRFLQASTPEVGATPADAGAVRGLDQRRIRVVTDMGFDDWGAFAVLDAAGLSPEKALASHGMMKPDFAGNLSKILGSWGLTTSVHRGTENCFQAAACPDDSFIDGWGYRTNVREKTPWAIRAGYDGPAQVEEDPASFWSEMCDAPEKVTLLILGPVSDAAIWLSDAANAHQLGCIDEIILSGGFLKTSNQGSRVDSEDPSTVEDVLVGLFPNITSGSEGELNVVSDARAAHQLLKFVREGGVRLRIVPLEVESMNRIGKDLMKVMASSLDKKQQEQLTQASFEKLCSISLNSASPSLLSNMACMLSAGGDVHTLDMDAIVATSIWTPELFTFAQLPVSIDEVTGLTSLCDPGSKMTEGNGCMEVEVATDFDTVQWLKNLQAAMQLQVNRGMNCFPGQGADEPASLGDVPNDPFLSAADQPTAVTRCWQACQDHSDCTGFVIGADSEAAYNCYLRSNIDTGSCSSDTRTASFATYVVRPSLTKREGYNCYPGHGADEPPALPMSLNDPFLKVVETESVLGGTAERSAEARCLQACSSTQGCTGFVLGADGGAYNCYLRSNVELANCVPGGGFATYVVSGHA